MNTKLKDFMPKMGTGERSSEDLNYEESRDAMASILSNDLDPVTFGAFTVAERWKGQSPEELAGFLDEIREEHLERPQELLDSSLVDVSGRFDGKAESVNTEFSSSILASVCGTNVATHTGRNVPTQEGTTFLDIVDHLDWIVEPTFDRSLESLDQTGFTYTNTAIYSPNLDGLREHRRSLGVRCFLNTIESMMNPFDADVHVGSFYHLAYAARVCNTFDQSNTQSPERVIMIQGIEGQTELRPGDCILGEWKDGELIDHDLHTADFGLDFTRDQLESEGADAVRSAELLKKFSRGEAVPAYYRESVLLNTACRIYADGQVESIEEGLDVAEDACGSREHRVAWNDIAEVFKK